MPKETFYNISEDKRERILQVLRTEFEEKPIFDVSIKKITEKLDIARASFYQYFDSLEESYYTVLEKETVDIHIIFVRLFMEHNGDLSKTLRDFGEELANEVFHDHNYMIYKNRYMY